MKLKLTLAYNGARFLGSASQPHKLGVANALANGLAHLGIYEKPLFASRTDKGVHASAAVASIECGEHFKDLEYLKRQINKFSAPYIFIKEIKPVSSNFNVRFDAVFREYRYVFCHNKFSPFLSELVHFYPKFDISLANELLAQFVGEHDFKYFSKQNDMKTSVRKMLLAKAYSHKDFSVFKFRANGFLRAQIRLSVSAILAVLEGRLSKENLQEQIDAKKAYIRSLAPANGLYLSRIGY